MPNDSIIAQAADGTQHVFPAGTDPSVIDRAMKQYVLPQVNASNLKRSAMETPFEAKNKGGAVSGPAREAALGAFSGAGIPETQTPIKDLGSNLVQQFQDMAGKRGAEQALRANPAVAIPTSLAEGFGKTADATNPLIDNLFRWLSNNLGGRKFDYKPVDAGQTAHDVTSFATQAALLKGGSEKVPEALGDLSGKAGLRKMGQEVMGQGPSKINVLSDQHAHAISTQQHLATVADAVHQDAQAAMAEPLSKMAPYDKGEVGLRLKSSVGEVELADMSQLPKSVRELLPTETTGKQPGPNIGGKVLDLSKPEDMGAYQKYKNSGAFTPEEIAKYEGKATGSMTAEELKQARSDLGAQLGRLKGTALAAGNAAYGEMSKMLREGARAGGVEPQWIDANARYKNYVDDFVRSPLKNVLDSENAHDIMEPLSGKSRMQVQSILQKYTPFGLDMDKINQEIAGFGTGETVLKMSNPSKMDLLLARMSPSAVALRQIGPRLFRNPSVIRAIGGEGFEPANIKPNKIYPTKEAAAAALKGKDIPPGKPTMFGGEVGSSEWESPDEAARRGASGEDPKLKSIRRHFEKERD